MKVRKLLFFAAIVGAVASILNKQKQLEAPTTDGIWKPVDPLSE
jgi:hypothetical protein